MAHRTPRVFLLSLPHALGPMRFEGRAANVRAVQHALAGGHPVSIHAPPRSATRHCFTARGHAFTERETLKKRLNRVRQQERGHGGIFDREVGFSVLEEFAKRLDEVLVDVGDVRGARATT